MKKQTERGEDGIVKVKPKRGYPPMRNGCVNEGAGGGGNQAQALPHLAVSSSASPLASQGLSFLIRKVGE